MAQINGNAKLYAPPDSDYEDADEDSQCGDDPDWSEPNSRNNKQAKVQNGKSHRDRGSNLGPRGDGPWLDKTEEDEDDEEDDQEKERKETSSESQNQRRGRGRPAEADIKMFTDRTGTTYRASGEYIFDMLIRDYSSS